MEDSNSKAGVSSEEVSLVGLSVEFMASEVVMMLSVTPVGEMLISVEASVAVFSSVIKEIGVSKMGMVGVTKVTLVVFSGLRFFSLFFSNSAVSSSTPSDVSSTTILVVVVVTSDGVSSVFSEAFLLSMSSSLIISSRSCSKYPLAACSLSSLCPSNWEPRSNVKISSIGFSEVKLTMSELVIGGMGLYGGMLGLGRLVGRLLFHGGMVTGR